MDSEHSTKSSALTTIAAKIVGELAWTEPFEEASFTQDFRGKVLVSQTHWLVLAPVAQLTKELGQAELEKWFAVLKSVKSGRPGRIDVVFLLEEEPGPESKSTVELKRQTFLGAGVYLNYLSPALDSNVLSIPDKSLKSALLVGAKQAQDGANVDEEAYRLLKEDSAQAYLALEEKLGKVKPIGTRAIFGCCLLMFLWAELLGGGTENVFTLFRFGANYPPATLGGEWWRLVGAMFMHIGWVHLFVNLYSLLAVGCLLEKVYGNFKYLALYSVSGLVGSLASASLGSGAISAGASGALFGLFGATALTGYRYKSEFPANFSKALSQGMLPAIIYNLIYGFSSTSIDNAAHLGGLAAGVLFALVTRPDILTDESNPSLVLPLAILGTLPFFVQGYVAYRAQVYDSMSTYPTTTYTDDRKLIRTTLPDIFREVTEEGETYLSGPGVNVVLFSIKDPHRISVEQPSLKNSILEAFPDARFSVQDHRGVRWLLEEGKTQEVARLRAFAYIDDNLFKVEIYAHPDNKKQADQVRETAMNNVHLPGWEGEAALEKLLTARLFERALIYLKTLEESSEIQLKEVVCRMELGQFDEALSLMDEHSDAWPSSFPKRQLRAKILAGQGEYQKAFAILDAWQENLTEAERDEHLLLRAEIAYQAGRGEEADAFCRQLLQSEQPQIQAEALSLMAGQKVSQGTLQEAIDLATRSLEIVETPQALTIRGRAHLELGQAEQANTDFDRSFDLSPNSAEVNYYIARLLEQQEEVQTAQLFYERYLFLTGPNGEFVTQATTALSSNPGEP